MNVTKCPSTLKDGFNSFSPGARRLLFDGRKVSHVLPFSAPESNEVIDIFNENRSHISISGAQIKLSLILDKNELRLTNQGEHGQYILKPIAEGNYREKYQMPANEHVTMQIASQVFDISTAPNAMVFFQDGTPSYLTRRFNVLKDGKRLGMDDFASLSGRTKETAGDDFKFETSIEELFHILKKYTGVYTFERVKLFRLVLFNYVFSNGDAHLKNYSMLETDQTDYILSPAYDLMNTRLHLNDTDIALKKGLFADGYKRNDYNEIFGYDRSDFEELGRRVDIPKKLIRRELDHIISKTTEVKRLVKQSFLSDAAVVSYLNMYIDRRNRLRK